MPVAAPDPGDKSNFPFFFNYYQLFRKSMKKLIGGVEFNFKKTGIGINGQLPIAQDFAEGQTRMNFKGMMHITFSI
jgi:hypothetical protein